MPYLGRTPAGAAGNKITGALKVTGALSADSIHDNIILNGTDGSSTDATDNVILNGTDSSSTDADDNIIYEEYTQGIVTDSSVPTAGLVDDAVTLAKMASGTDGNLISYDASGNPVAIATGSDGQVLHSAGAGAPPAFETLTAGFTQGTLQTTTS